MFIQTPKPGNLWSSNISALSTRLIWLLLTMVSYRSLTTKLNQKRWFTLKGLSKNLVSAKWHKHPHNNNNNKQLYKVTLMMCLFPLLSGRRDTRFYYEHVSCWERFPCLTERNVYFIGEQYVWHSWIPKLSVNSSEKTKRLATKSMK